MPTVEELLKKFETFEKGVETMKKDFELKIESAQKDAASYKAIALQKEEDLKKFKADAEKAIEEKNKAFAETRKAENASFLEGLKKAGKISAAMEVTCVKLMESMNTETIVHTFEAKDGLKVNHTQLSLFKELLSSFGASPIFRNLTHATAPARIAAQGGEDKEKVFTTVITKAGAQNYEVDGMDLHALAVQFQEDQRKVGITVDYADALIAAEKQLKQAA